MDVVKRSEAGMIDEPITISPNATIGEADAMCGRFHISGVPVVDRELRLLGPPSPIANALRKTT